MNKPFWIGTAPFCKPSEDQCYDTPGYIPGDKSKCGDGSCCWSGHKIQCKFDEETWKKSSLYRQMRQEKAEDDEYDETEQPKFSWVGEAPFCSKNYINARL